MTQLPKPSGAEDGVNARTGCAEKNFDTQLIPSLQPLVDESGADAIIGTHVDAQGSVRCGQVATKSTKNPERRSRAEPRSRGEMTFIAVLSVFLSVPLRLCVRRQFASP